MRGPFRFSQSSLNRFRGVHPELVALATRALEISPLDFAVTQGVRTEDQQQDAFDGGFSECNPSAGCVSKHQRGRALDLAPIFDGRVELNSRARIRELAPFVKQAADELGVRVKWLGEPDSEFVDVFHWELAADVGAPNLDGYRRAQQSEVDEYTTAQARAALPHDLGDIRGPFINDAGQRFKVRLEVHSNAPKGASVYLHDSATGVA
jgi:peptidoglycan L-alanyl-D-glutamate endopeptidase CwlK